MHSSRLLMVPGVTLLLIVGERLTTAWVPFQHQPRRPAAVVVARAKPPPAAQFDLAAIEAFESQLDAQEKEEAGLLDEDDIDSDWHIKDTEVIWSVDDARSGRRLDAALVALAAKHAENKDYGRTNNIDINDSNAATLTRTMAGSWITEGRVKVDGAVVTRKSLSVATGQMLTIQWPAPQQDHQRIIAQDLALDILYEDEVMIVLNKAPGMVVHPAVGHWDGTVVNALAYYLAHRSPYGPGEFAVDDELDATSDTGLTREYDYWRPGVVHRLDKGTTGVLVFAKTRAALSQLSAAFADRKVKKTYLAISIGNPGTNVRIDKPIGRHPIHRQRMRVVPNPHKHGALPESAMPTSTSGRNALSFVDTLAFDGRLSLVQVRIATGRTHQIRVHLADRHTPIYGDDLYGIADWNAKLQKQLQQQHEGEEVESRPLLHAYKLGVPHPITGKPMVFKAPVPSDFGRIAKAICGPDNLPSFLRDDEKQEREA